MLGSNPGGLHAPVRAGAFTVKVEVAPGKVYFAGGGVNSDSWYTVIIHSPFCLVITQLSRPLRGGASAPSGVFAPVICQSISTCAIDGVRKRIILTVSVL